MKQGWRRHIGYRQGVSHNPNSVVAFTWSTGGDITHDRFWAGFRAYMDFFVECSDAESTPASSPSRPRANSPF